MTEPEIQNPQTEAVQPQAVAQAVATEAPPVLPSSATPGVTTQTRVSMLPEAPLQEPPRPLVAGAFLRQEFEIKGLLSRGMTNIYAAQSGDYGATAAKLIAERDVPQSVKPTIELAVAPTASAPIEATTEAAQSGASPSNMVDAATSIDDAAGSGAFVEDVDTLSSTPLPQSEVTDPLHAAASDAASPAAASPAAAASNTAAPGADFPAVVMPADVAVEPPSATSANAMSATTSTSAVAEPASAEAPPGQDASRPEALQSPLFPPREAFAQDEREYLVFDYFESESLLDYREPTNDERLLSMLSALANGLRELEEKGLRAELTTETLRVADSKLFYVGFVESQPPNQAGNSLEQLREITSFLLKRVFAESTTMRLDDEYGSLPLSDDLKEVARRINENEFGSVAEAAQAINHLCTSTRLHVEAALLSDVGRERELNEDSGMIVRYQRSAHLDSRELELYVVADGMGGHEGGEVASDLTLTSLQKHIDGHAHIDWNDNVAVRATLISIIDAVNADVVALTETPKYKGTRAKPGSTLTFALRLGARVFIGNVGDSRAYKYSNGVLTRISKDHSYVQTLIDRGEITEEEAFDHPEGSIITAHIGYPKLRQRDVFLRLFAPGDKLLLVSDGVTDMLRDREYEPHIQHEDPADVCRALVDASNAAGGADNITVVCVQFS
jgi:serine/threonine protein phosphatase PrpC